MVGTARCAVRAASSGASETRLVTRLRDSASGHGRTGHRSAASLPCQTIPLLAFCVCCAVAPVGFGRMKRDTAPRRTQLAKLVRELKKKVAAAAARQSRRLRDSEARLRAILGTAVE